MKPTLRLVAGKGGQQWDNRWHFSAAAAEAMRRITLNRARDKKRLKRGGDFRRIKLEQAAIALDSNEEDGVHTTRSKTSVGSNCSFRQI
jgi:hypothetical protein